MKEFCVDLEIAKELKKEGFSQKGNFFYHNINNKYQILSKEDFQMINPIIIGGEYNAPTSDEILKELPKFVESEEYELNIIQRNIEKGTFEFEENGNNKNKFEIFYGVFGGEVMKTPEFENKKLSNAVAKMWLYLKKEGYIK